jgi:hypothetical protein
MLDPQQTLTAPCKTKIAREENMKIATLCLANIYTAEVADAERVQKFRRIDLQN